MWNYSILTLNVDGELIKKIKKYAKISGTILTLLGLAGIIFPTFMSLATEVLVSYLMLLAGVGSAVLTWMVNRKDWAAWLKSFVLMGVALWMILNPLHGVATLGLIFSFYFFTDAFAGFGIAFSLKPDKVWWIWLFNALTSLVLGVVFIIGWPFSSLYMIGLFIGVSLLFDGIALLMGGTMLEEDKK
jgi:uncharacterized membrane protein HdeD (DUF308 family)